MSEDLELLRDYASGRSEVAFNELVRRHVNLVYSAALRLAGGDSHQAEDVTQQVFTELARQAPKLARHPALIGWLYTTTRRMALKANRTDQRRRAREQEAHAMNEIGQSAPEPDWQELRPIVDEAMHQLGESDRLALLLRYFQNQSLREVGLALGLSENTARMRVARALDKLRAQLSRRGVTSTAGLALLLSGNAVSAAPAMFVSNLSGASLAAAAAGKGTTLTLLKIMTTATKIKLGIIGAIVIASAVTTTVAVRHYHHQKQPAATGPGYVPASKWHLAGYATPEDALQTYLSAALLGDSKNMDASLTPAAMDEYEKSLKHDSQTKEQYIVEIAKRTKVITGYRILQTFTNSADHVVLKIVLEHGWNPDDDVKIQKIDGEWKVDESPD